ncbi:MAG: acyl-CoA desaturase [Betaproteobacteria bacterium]|nr:acyl-CoA desaturase [Betaproteobacteria bacterium]
MILIQTTEQAAVQLANDSLLSHLGGLEAWLRPLLHWVAYGFSEVSLLGLLIVALVTTHITIAAVTIFLHRCQAHRALDLHPLISHFFRFWLWLNTGMVTKEWAAIHRKHHAKCETEEDPHSPVTRGLETVLFRGVELYRIEALNQETMDRYGHGTPDDWIERVLYTRHSYLGVYVLLLVDLLLFGAMGLAMFAIQTGWIPFFAAGVINGVGHAKGYRNFDSSDKSGNISPWGILIGGEELHNNHHTFPASARLSYKWWEFDIGWMYIQIMVFFGLAKVRRVSQRPKFQLPCEHIDARALQAVIANRYDMMSAYARSIREAKRAKADDALQTLTSMRAELASLWERSSLSVEQLVQQFEDWCRRAEASGVGALRELSLRARSYA